MQYVQQHFKQGISTSVLREADGERRRANFVGKQVFLVEKQNHRRVDEPTVVADGVKQLHAFCHSILMSNTHKHWHFS